MSVEVKQTTPGGGKQLPPVTTEVIQTTNNNNTALPNTQISGQMESLSLTSGPNVSVVTPPVLQISQPPDQDGSDTSSSEYESFPDTSSDHEPESKTFEIKDISAKVDNAKVTNIVEHEIERKEHGVESEVKQISGNVAIVGSPEKEWVPPNSELCDKIVKQVEFYFSDANITKDAFLLKHVRRNKHGFVSIKLISSFKKVRKLTKDWKVVSFSLKSSMSLEVNSEGTKVRRKEPLPDIDLSTPLRTVVVTNFSEENPSVEIVKGMFKHCGKVTLVRIVRPNKPFPPDVQRHIGSHLEVVDKVCGLVEFEKCDAAQKAVKTMNSEDDWRSGLLVKMLAKVAPNKKGKEKNSKEGQLGHDHGHLSGGDAENEKGKQRKKRRSKNKNRVDVLSHHDGSLSVTPSSSDCENSPSPNRRHTNKPIPIPNSNHLSPSGTPKSSPCPSPHGSPRGQRKFQGGRSTHSGSPHSRGGYKGGSSPHGSPELRRKVYDKSDKEGQSDSSNSPSPWFQRRRMLAAQSQDASPGSSPMLTRRMINPKSGAKPHLSGREGILRMPSGPEPNKGFYEGKGRGQPICN